MQTPNKEFNKLNITYTSPSNIAFIKYWGKKYKQLPMNPSLSMTLDKCYTKTSVEFTKNNKTDFKILEFLLDGIQNDKFSARIEEFIDSNKEEFIFLNGFDLKISTSNNFPHSSGIASSASGMSAIVMSLLELEASIINKEIDLKKASYLSRLASGSASRSVYGAYTTWGSSSLEFSSDEYAVSVNEFENFPSLLDTIVIVSKTEKTVSSSAGHNLMNAHPFAQARYDQARDNLVDMVQAMKDNDLKTFGEILELEALTLHALMMSSSPSYILLEPASLAIIHLIRQFREETSLPLYFTIDAGPNIHMIYPESIKDDVDLFIKKKIQPACLSIIYDKLGTGPKLIEKYFD